MGEKYTHRNENSVGHGAVRGCRGQRSKPPGEREVRKISQGGSLGQSSGRSVSILQAYVEEDAVQSGERCGQR